MERESFKVSVPGSVMLMGEHAVLKGSRCICAAIDRRISIRVEPMTERSVLIESDLGTHTASFDRLDLKSPFEFVLAAFRKFASDLSHGVRLRIESGLPADVGFGSSAAVTVATVAAGCRLSGRESSPRLVIDHALGVVREVQGRASGADCAASALGGIVGYRMDPFELSLVQNRFPLTLVYCGYKRKTAEVIALVQERASAFKEGFIKLNELVHWSVNEALNAVEEQDLKRVGLLMDFNQGLMDSMGVCNADLSSILYQLRAAPEIHGAKISGSGLGDCVVGLGRVDEDFPLPNKIFHLDIAEEGLRFEQA